jgi:hypothetical protein
MARDLMHELEAARGRFRKGQQWEGEALEDFYERLEARSRVWADSRDPAFNLLPPNTLPETRRQRAEARAKLSAASRVRDRGEVELCHGTGECLGVACPGCRECGEGDGP